MVRDFQEVCFHSLETSKRCVFMIRRLSGGGSGVGCDGSAGEVVGDGCVSG